MLRGVLGLRDDDGDRLAGELRLAHSKHRPIGIDGPVTGNRLRQVASRENAAHAWYVGGIIGMNRDDASVRARQRDQLDVQHVLEADIGRVLLRARDALDSAEPRDR